MLRRLDRKARLACAQEPCGASQSARVLQMGGRSGQLDLLYANTLVPTVSTCLCPGAPAPMCFGAHVLGCLDARVPWCPGAVVL